MRFKVGDIIYFGNNHNEGKIVGIEQCSTKLLRGTDYYLVATSHKLGHSFDSIWRLACSNSHLNFVNQNGCILCKPIDICYQLQYRFRWLEEEYVTGVK